MCRGLLVVMTIAAMAAGAVCAQETIQATTADGATYSVAAQWPLGQTLSASGTNWTNSRGNAGSTIAVVYDFGSVPSPDQVDDEIWLRIQAERDGSWSAELPFPSDAGWAVGEVHKVHLLSGSLGHQDKARGPVVDVLIVEAP